MRALPLLVVLAACSCGAPRPVPRGPALRRLVDAELLSACITDTGIYRYQAPGYEADCAVPEPVLWPRDRFPLTVEGQASPGCGYTDTLRPAVDLVNAQLGFEALRVVRSMRHSPGWRPPDVLVRQCVAIEYDVLGYALHVAMAEGDPAALVVLGRIGDWRTAALVTAHELGHALGLAHDPEQRGSIMFPGATAVFGISRFTDDDVAVLRALYAPPSR